jgi:exopolysaccharide biosynthesis polyprenyl glycosylphosphotransferase
VKSEADQHMHVSGVSPLQALESGEAFGRERRMPAARERMSWASYPPPVSGTPLARYPKGDASDPLRAADRRRESRVRPLLLKAGVGDLLCALTALTAVVLSYDPVTSTDLAGIGVLTAVWGLFLWLGGGYDWRSIADGPEGLQIIARCAVGLVAALSVLAFAMQLEPPRRYVLIAIPLMALLTVVHRYILRKSLHRARAKGRSLLRTLVVGDLRTAQSFSSSLDAAPEHGYKVVGACVTAADYPPATTRLPVWGTVSDVPQIALEQQIDVVLVVSTLLSGEPLRRLSWALERTGADLVIAPGLIEVTGSRTMMRPAAGLSLIHVDSPAHLRTPVLKEVGDRVICAALLVFGAPILLLAMIAVRKSGPGPVFYRQVRVGRNGKPFVMYKFRTMSTDADVQRSGLVAFSDRDGLMFKMRRDPRITPAGRWLRRFSIDELPQLWNIVRGDMALVGPRPPLPEEHARYQDAVHRRLRVKPGLTGLWQVSGRADLPWDESIRLDLRYVDNWSITMDLQIMWKTVRAVLRGKGAY